MIKKALLLSTLSLSPLLALDLLEPAFGLWGLGAGVKNSNYKGEDTKVRLNPYIFGGYGIVNIEANRVNIDLYTTDYGLSFAALGQLRTHQSSNDDSPVDTDDAIEAGLQLSYPLGLGFTSRLSYLQDVSNKHKGNELEVQVFRHDNIGELSILSSLSLQRESRGLLEYYYGTSNYSPDLGLAGELELIVTYPIDNWAVFAGVRHYVYDNEVDDSPLTNSNTITQSFFGLGYNF